MKRKKKEIQRNQFFGKILSNGKGGKEESGEIGQKSCKIEKIIL